MLKSNKMEQIYRVLFNNPPLSLEEIAQQIPNPPENLNYILWYKTPGIRIYRKFKDSSLLEGFYFCPNKASNPQKYKSLKSLYSN
jgi:hypothetical protein